MDRLTSFIRRYWVPLLALCTLALFLSIADHVFLFHGGDNADYISLARSLSFLVEDSRLGHEAAIIISRK